MQKSRQPSGSLTAGHLSTSTRVLVVSPMHCMKANHLFMCIRDESGLLNRAYTENTDPRRYLTIFGSHPFVDLSATLPGGSQKGTPLLRPSRLLANCPLSEPQAEDYESFVPQRHDRIDMRRISRRYIACRERNDRKKSRGAAEGQGIARSHAI